MKNIKSFVISLAFTIVFIGIGWHAMGFETDTNDPNYINDWNNVLSDQIVEPLFDTYTFVNNIPTGIKVTSITSSSVDIDWDFVSGNRGYELSHRIKGTSDWSSVFSTLSNFTLSGLECNTTYEYLVRTDCGNNSYSEWASMETFTTETLLSNTPKGMAVTSITNSTVEIDWGFVSGNRGYELKHRIKGTSVWSSVTPTLSKFTITGLASSTTYEYLIRTNCGNNNYSEWTSTNTFVTKTQR